MFMRSLRDSKIHTIVVECAFRNDEFTLTRSPDILRVRSNSLLWQKERLINIAARYLPSTCRYVAWIDCDVLFQNEFWAVEAASLLAGRHTIVQLFETCTLLEQGNIIPENPQQFVSFASVTSKDPSTLNCGRYDRHGHPGFAWAMDRKLFDALGLYEFAVSGGADHYIAHAALGRYGFCVDSTLGYSPVQIKHFRDWADQFHALAKSKLGVVSGNIFHLWHGSRARRDYFNRIRAITKFGFDPYTDTVSRPGRPLEWTNEALLKKPELVRYFDGYFLARREDEV